MLSTCCQASGCPGGTPLQTAVAVLVHAPWRRAWQQETDSWDPPLPRTPAAPSGSWRIQAHPSPHLLGGRGLQVAGVERGAQRQQLRLHARADLARVERPQQLAQARRVVVHLAPLAGRRGRGRRARLEQRGQRRHDRPRRGLDLRAARAC